MKSASTLPVARRVATRFSNGAAEQGMVAPPFRWPPSRAVGVARVYQKRGHQDDRITTAISSWIRRRLATRLR